MSQNPLAAVLASPKAPHLHPKTGLAGRETSHDGRASYESGAVEFIYYRANRMHAKLTSTFLTMRSDRHR